MMCLRASNCHDDNAIFSASRKLCPIGKFDAPQDPDRQVLTLGVDCSSARRSVVGTDHRECMVFCCTPMILCSALDKMMCTQSRVLLSTEVCACAVGLVSFRHGGARRQTKGLRPNIG